jgi:hypothetical protein
MGFAALYPSYHRRGSLAQRVRAPPYRASTSTSPSTPVMTLKLRS